MNKKTVVKYAYFTILLLLPYAFVFFPTNGINPFKLFLAIPWVIANIDITDFRIVIYGIFFMLINFFIATLLYKIYKKKPNGLYIFLSIVLLFFLITLPLGGDMRIFVYLVCGLFTFCPLYFYGISYYNRRFVDKEHEAAEDNTHNSQSDE